MTEAFSALRATRRATANVRSISIHGINLGLTHAAK
jgi:hypothetical protein